jgi:cytoskeletal protein CcmA (bactofilin family)
MNVTAIGPRCEQNGSSSHPHSNGQQHNGTRNKVVFPNGHAQPNGQSQPTGQLPVNGHAQPNGGAQENGNVLANGHGNGASTMSHSSPRQSRFAGLTTSLSSGVSIKGTLKFRSELHMDGQVEGTIESLGRLTVGRNGRVRGDIQTRSVTVHGTVDGNLSVGEKCELRSGCTLRGDIETSSLVVDEDVNFIGNAEIATRDYLSELRPLNDNRLRVQLNSAELRQNEAL